MSEQRLTGWNKQKPAFTYANEREFGPGLRKAALYADPKVSPRKSGIIYSKTVH